MPKPSFTNQRRVPGTDRKFRPEDERLVAQNKEELASGAHGDAVLAPEQTSASTTPPRDDDDRSTGER